MKETSTDYLPDGYVIVDEIFTKSPKDVKKILDGATTPTKGDWDTQEPFKLTEEEYQWLISLCCPGRA